MQVWAIVGFETPRLQYRARHATLKGAGVSGKGTAKVAAGKVTSIAMNVKGPAGKTVPATFTIVLKTNGRTTTEKKTVRVSFAK